MEHRQLGRSGLKVPVLSLGTGTFGGTNEFFQRWGQTDVAEATRMVDLCLDAGVNLFDTADADGRIAAGGAEGGPIVADEYLYNVVDALDAVASEVGKTVAQTALNWLLQRPTVANIVVGARNEEQLRQNLGATGWSLTPEQVGRLDEASHETPIYPYWHQTGFDARNPKPTRWS